MIGFRRGSIAIAFLITACGGKVVFVELADAGGTGGASSTVTSSTSTGADCAALANDLAAKTLAARACAPELDVIQCSGSAIVSDECGCASKVLNETQSPKVADAEMAFAAFAQGNCVHPCENACLPASAGTCELNEDGTGTCIAVFPK